MKKYLFRKYNDKYPKYFAQERRKLIKFLGKSINIEHVGSTAVPNLGGKGILDLVIGAGAKNIDKIKKALIKMGYEFCPEAGTNKRLFFKRDIIYKSKSRRVHLHLTQIGGTNWFEFVGFRDYLLGQPDIVKKYITIKKRAVLKACGDGKKYRKYKEKFIAGILRRI